MPISSLLSGRSGSIKSYNYETADKRNHLEIRKISFWFTRRERNGCKSAGKVFHPSGIGTWLITEAERKGDDWRLFGYCHLFE